MASQQSSIISSFTNNGTLRGTGNVLTNVINNAAGQVVIGAGERMVFGPFAFTNSGLVSVIHGEAQFDGALTNNATGSIAGHDNTLRFNGGVTNNRSLLVPPGPTDTFRANTKNHRGENI